MGYYFEDFLSIHSRTDGAVRSTLRTIANRYIGENPPSPPVFRASSSRGIMRSPDWRYRFELGQIYPAAPDFSLVYAWGALYVDQARNLPLAFSIDGPLKFYLNGSLVFKSHIGHERTANQKHHVDVALQVGWNDLVCEFMKTPRGFGGTVGTGNKKSAVFHVLAPSRERLGAEGWIYSLPLGQAIQPDLKHGYSETDTGLTWFPERAWEDFEQNLGAQRRLYGFLPGQSAWSWSSGDFRQSGEGGYHFSGEHSGACTILVAEQELYRAEQAGSFDFSQAIPFGQHRILVESVCGNTDWGFSLAITGPEQNVKLSLPVVVHGSAHRWLEAGPFARRLDQSELGKLLCLHRPFASSQGMSYFRLDAPDTFIRPFMETGLFGHWHYSLGVILYGLLIAGRIIESADIEGYAQKHLQAVCDWYQYARWDGQRYGASSLLHHLYQMDSLDDCGSAGSSLLEATFRVGIENYLPLIEDIAGYVAKRQERLPDGTFYRNKPDNPFMAGTIWADDLYMSVPFMMRYWKLTGNEHFIQDTIRQFRNYRHYLFQPDRRTMSHAFDVIAGMPTGVPWGRGNGWVVFSLTEMLDILPASHADWPEMLAFYQELCSGYLALQDPDGLWHQILTDPDSYPETSCTCMFLYSFARGLRKGWLPAAGFGDASRKAWQALCRSMVDHRGNVWGICRGSGISFTESYYRDELPWIMNDLHGIGILLIAGAEFLDMESSSRQQLLDPPLGVWEADS